MFYLVILGVGLYAAWKNKKMRREAEEAESAEDVILAKRNINLFVGVMTMTGREVFFFNSYCNLSPSFCYLFVKNGSKKVFLTLE